MTLSGARRIIWRARLLARARRCPIRPLPCCPARSARSWLHGAPRRPWLPPSTVPRGRANIRNEGTVFHEHTRKSKENCCLQSASQNCLKNKQKLLSTPDAARGSFMRGARGASSFTPAPCAGFLCLRGVSWQWTVSTHPRGGVAEPTLLCSVWPCVPWAEVIFCHYGLIPRP